MKDCQIEPDKHSWVVIAHSTGPAALLFLQCIDCGIERLLPLTQEEWSDYLNELSEAGRVWVARHFGLPYPFELLPGESPPAPWNGKGDVGLQHLVNGLDLFEDEDNEDIPF